MVSLGVRGSTIPTTLLEFRCAPVGTGTALVRKPARIYWVEVETLTADRPSRGSVPLSPTPPQTHRTSSSPVPASPALQRTPVRSTPPMSTSVLSYISNHLQPSASHQLRSQGGGHQQPTVPRHRVQQPGPEPAEVEAAEVVDYYGLEGCVHLVKLQDPSLATERKIHYHTPGQLGPLRRWYIV